MSLSRRLGQLSGQDSPSCYHCHKCRAGCPILPAMDYGLDRMLRILHLGQWERVLTSRDVWLCLGCEMYGPHCLGGINVGNVMLALREIAAAQGYRSEDCDELGDRPRDGLRNQLHDTPRNNQPIAPDDLDPPEVDNRLWAGIQRLNQLSQAVPAAHNVSSDDSNDRLIRSQNMAHIPEGLTREARTGLVYFVGCVGAFFAHRYRLPQALPSCWRLPVST